MRVLLIVLLLVFAVAPSVAQTQTPNKERLRRQQARSLLIALSTDARAFHDQTLRARSLARIADALWTIDAEQGRLLFRKSWEAAEVADRENEQKTQEQIKQQQTKTGRSGYAISMPPSLRREVLRLAARKDRALGEEFLEKLKTERAEAATNAKLNPGKLNDSLSQRLGLAAELMANGDTERALQFAEPVLTIVSMETINFLLDLRQKDDLSAEADRRYAALLASSMTNPQADANTVSLLSSYIFTPRLYVVFMGTSMSSSQMNATTKPTEVSPELRNAFFQTAGAILLRPLPPPGQDPGPAGIDGKYLVIKRLMPFAEQYAPPELVESLRGQVASLNTVVSDSARRRDNDEWLNRGVRPEKPAADREQELMNRLETAKTSSDRDAIYIQLANLVTREGDLRAREFASKIEDPELRKEFGAYIDGQLVNYHVQKKQADPALEIIRKGEITQLHRAWALTQIAKFMVKTDREAAVQLIEEAANAARRIDVSDPGRPRALIAVATALKDVDPTRIWDATFDAVKAANSAEGFSGEDGELLLQFQSKHQSSVNTNDAPDFDLDGIFKELANQDYDRAVELARGFEHEGPRAVATISIARAVLEPQKGSKKESQKAQE